MPKDDSSGTTSANFQINGLSGGYQLITANYTAAIGDFSIRIDASGGSVTLTLPSLSTAYKGKPYRVMRSDGTLLTAVSVVSNAGSKTINGASSIALTQYVGNVFIYDGTNWWRF
jgi:hypothetical protein